MPDDTTILSLPLILPAQAQKHVTHNEALVQLDLIVQLAVIDRTLTTAPALPSIGDRHIVAAGATGPWVGQAGRIALYTVAGWQFTQALPGWQAHVIAEGQTAVFDGLAWKTPSEGPLSVTQLGVAATADAVNRLSVSSPATLLNHAGAGHQLKLNKATAGDTASLLFQTGFGGRAEMGTAGSDDFSVKVSADGAAWATALQADAATGEVTLPQPLRLGGQAADPASPVDGTLWLNSATGEVKVRSGGVSLPVGGAGGGSPGGMPGEIQWNDGGLFAGAADVGIEEGQLRLPAIATPAVPVAGGLKLYGKSVAGRVMPTVAAPVGREWPVQAFLGQARIGAYLCAGNGANDTQLGSAWTATGTATSASVQAGSNLHQLMRRREWLITTASATAACSFRGSNLQWTLGGAAAGQGGFHMSAVWGPATGVATATTRGFFGMRGSAAAPTDVNPSTLTNICGMGWDSGDATLSFMHNDGSGTATKIGLGASFPRPNADRSAVYRIELFAPPGTTQALSYEITDLVGGAVATGTVTTDLPSTATLLTPWSQLSVGGTSSVIGIMLSFCYIESDN